MEKRDAQKRVLKNGEPLALGLFEWDEKTKTFSSEEDNLVFDFDTISDCTFKTGSYCTFKTGSYCTFDTGSYCTFDTGSDCTFDTIFDCTFKTRSDCTFDTGSDCTFDTGSDCTFDTGSDCTFDTGSDCTFDTGSDCVVVRRDIYELIELKKRQKIKLNTYNKKGYSILSNKKTISMDEIAKKFNIDIKDLKIIK